MTTPLAEPGRYTRSSLASRPRYHWPHGAALALGFVVSLETWELAPPAGSYIPANVPGAFGRGPYPDIGTYSRRAYGNRIGAFRVIRELSAHGMPATVAMDALTARGNPAVVGACRRLGWEIAAHGIASTRVHSSLMSVEEERAAIGSALHAVAEAAGAFPAGWHGPEHGESVATPDLLAEHGVAYVLDWPHDEQPVTLQTHSGALASLPMSLELDDVYAHWQRRLSMAEWRDAVVAAIDELLADASTGRMLLLNLHPWLIGHPFRVSYLREVLVQIASRAGIWRATAGAIHAWHTGGHWRQPTP